MWLCWRVKCMVEFNCLCCIGRCSLVFERPMSSACGSIDTASRCKCQVEVEVTGLSITKKKKRFAPIRLLFIRKCVGVATLFVLLIFYLIILWFQWLSRFPKPPCGCGVIEFVSGNVLWSRYSFLKNGGCYQFLVLSSVFAYHLGLDV